MMSLNRIELQAPFDNCLAMIISRHVTVSAFKLPGHRNLSSRSLAMHVRATLGNDGNEKRQTIH